VFGAASRVSTPYEDPKAFDGTAEESKMYDARCKQIATETFYVFSKVKK
jgi:protein-tyrosine phosphatase/arsenate reductase